MCLHDVLTLNRHERAALPFFFQENFFFPPRAELLADVSEEGLSRFDTCFFFYFFGHLKNLVRRKSGNAACPLSHRNQFTDKCSPFKENYFWFFVVFFFRLKREIAHTAAARVASLTLL